MLKAIVRESFLLVGSYTHALLDQFCASKPCLSRPRRPRSLLESGDHNDSLLTQIELAILCWLDNDELPRSYAQPRQVVMESTEFISEALGIPCSRYDHVSPIYVHPVIVPSVEAHLHRLARVQSHRVVYFQHGLLDNSLGWFAGNHPSPAPVAAWQRGYDVFCGNFRIGGAKHGLWEHAMQDLPSLLHLVLDIKVDEGIDAAAIDFTIVAHSMGAAAVLMNACSHTYRSCARISDAVLVCPAGVHFEMHLPWRILSPILEFSLAPFVDFLIFHEFISMGVAVAMWRDIIKYPQLVKLISRHLEMFFGGSIESVLYNEAFASGLARAACSTQLGVELWNMYKRQAFVLLDQGDVVVNLGTVGHTQPVNYLDHYDHVDFPVHCLAAQLDVLIPPANVRVHADRLCQANGQNQDRVYFQELRGVGHIDSVRGDSTLLVDYLSRNIWKETKSNDCK